MEHARGWNTAVPDMSTTERYVASIYFAVVTMTTTGYGDISGHDNIGFFALVVTVVLGMIIFGYALSLLAATLANADRAKYATNVQLYNNSKV